MILDDSEVVRHLRQAVHGLSGASPTERYVADMWRYVLDVWDRGRSGGDDPAGGGVGGERAVPYVPVDLDAFGLSLGQASHVLDIGCLGGYGLYDFACSCQMAGRGVPKLTGVDVDPVSVDVARRLAGVWGNGLDVSFAVGRSESLAAEDGSTDLVIARLLLPYTRIVPTLGEVSRVLKAGGLVLFQIHSPGYYARQFARALPRLKTCSYYLRPLVSGLLLKATGRQPSHRWFSETALEPATLVKLCRPLGLSLAWSGGPARRPLLLFLKPGEGEATAAPV